MRGKTSNYRSTIRSIVECYDCHLHVYDLKAHRANECKKSRKAKSDINARVNKKTRTPSKADGIDFYMLLDVSGSMVGGRLDAAKNTLREISTDTMSDSDRIAVVTFDSKAFFKLKPRPVGQIRRQQEMEPLLDRIFAQGQTALWDAIYMAMSQIRDKTKKTVMIVLTDGEDNSSTHTYQECLDLVQEWTNVSLSIIHINGVDNAQYSAMAQHGRGDYAIINEIEIVTTVKSTLVKYR